jgi:asparagine synthase (glutamine-hydrolysing)
MCGVAGIFSYSDNAPRVDPHELRLIRDHMRTRGPDGEGEWYSNTHSLGLAHRRLSIIDLDERSTQPMVSKDGRYVISFNGEIYNYRELRNQLQDKGHHFLTTSDTEVILHLFAEKGEAMLQELRGMFAIALWDNVKNKLLLARDPYGIKPLYYSDDGQTLRVASQVKALLAGGKVSRQHEPAGLVGFYLFGSVPEPFTLYEKIRAVPSSSYMWITSSGSCEPIAYFSIPGTLREAVHLADKFKHGERQEIIREHLLDSVRNHMEADVPVGAFLSAGIDSAALVGLMAELSGKTGVPITTITLGFEEFKGTQDDEVPLAEEIAKKYGTNHVIRRVSELEFQNDLPKILEVMDQPSIDGLNTWFVSKAASEQGLKVAISGLGGDELFGGYSAFRDIPHWVRCFSALSKLPVIGELATSIGRSSWATNGKINPKAWGLIKYGGTYAGAYLLKRGLFMPWELSDVLDQDVIIAGLETLKPMLMIEKEISPDPGAAFQRVASMESSLYMKNQLLRDSDWASMAHSLEIRVPLVDANLLNSLAPLIAATNADECKREFGSTPRPALPRELLDKQKTGFKTPIENWMENLDIIATPGSNAGNSRKNIPWARRWAYTVMKHQLAQDLA